MPEIHIAGMAEPISAPIGSRLSSAIWLSGLVPAQPLCNGLGLCGRCKARFLSSPPEPGQSEKSYFTSEELSAGWRLTCRHTLTHLVWLELPAGDIQATQGQLPSGTGPLYLGIDLGTTSIQWAWQDHQGKLIASGSTWNPQGGAGADVISRLEAAMTPQGLSTLSQLALSAVKDIVRVAGKENIAGVCLAANSAMTEILLEHDIAGLCASPYHLGYHGGDCQNLPGIGKVLFPPLPAPFIGGDISAGLCALLEKRPKYPFILIDLGTNAELALLGQDERLFLASAPLGPALEGIGPVWGQPAAPGVITRFTLSPRGLEPHLIPGADTIAGISATGYLSLMAILCRLGIMRWDGKLQQGTMPLARSLTRNLENGVLPLPGHTSVSHEDLELLLKVKATLALAIKGILARARVKMGEISEIFLAGSLGQYAEITDLLELGMLPRSFSGKIRVAGNTSLAGACLLAREPEKLSGLSALCSRAEIINLAEEPQFLAEFLKEMVWGSEDSGHGR